MTTRSRMTEPGFFDGPAWPRDNSSDFECDSPPDSPIFSSGYESIISEDLDLYEASLGVELTDEQINALNGRVEEFRAADYEDRERIVEDVFGSFNSTRPRCTNSQRVTLKTLIRQHLYGKVKPVAKKSAPNTRSQMAEEHQETTLTDQHISMLERWVPKFRAADTTGREKLVKEAADRIKGTLTEGAEFDRDAVISLIREHLYGKLKRGLKKSAFETRKWTYRDVLTAMHREQIHKLTVELSQNASGSRAYLGNYNKARNQVEKKLTENERVKYKLMAKEWSEKKLPPKMQQRMMTKNGPRAIKEFTTSAYNQFGMRVVVLAAFIDGEGDPSMTLFDYNDQNGGTSFKDCHKNWRQYQMVEDFSKWSARSLGASLTDGSEDESPRTQKKTEIKLKRNKDGYPLLPNLEDIDDHGLLYKKRLIGKFMGDVYETSIGAGKERVPWAELQRAQGDYIKPKYLPKEVTLQQYYHLRRKDVNAILEHWTQRQAASKVPLRFRKVAKAIRQNECTWEENDAAADGEPYEDAEGHLEDDGGRQAQQDGESQTGEGGNGSTEQAHLGQGLGTAAEDLNGLSRHSLGNGQGAAQPIITADAHAPQQTGKCLASNLPHTPLPHIQSRYRPHNHRLADGSQADQTNGPSAEDRQEPSHNATQRPADEGQPSQLGSTNGADDVQRPPASPNQANERQQSPPADDVQRPPPVSRNQANERQQSPPALQSGSREMKRVERQRHGKNEGDAADSPSSKRRKIDSQLDGAGYNTRRQSNRDRRPTMKAANDSATPYRTRSRSRR